MLSWSGTGAPMAKVHVWLLYRGGPTQPSRLQHYFQRQMEDPHLLNLGTGLFARLWRSILIWWRGKEVAQLQLTGPCPSLQSSEEQSRELNRILGSDYTCVAVHRYDGANAHIRLKETPKGKPILLFPLVPFRSGVLYSTLADARSHLELEGFRHQEIPPLSHLPSFVTIYAESIRESIISLNGETDYAVLLLLSRDAKNWHTASEELTSEINRFRSALKQKLHPNLTIVTALHIPDAIRQLQNLKEISHILYGYPFWTCDSYERLPANIDQLSFHFHKIPSLNTRPSFIRMLSDVIIEHSPTEPNISSPSISS